MNNSHIGLDWFSTNANNVDWIMLFGDHTKYKYHDHGMNYIDLSDKDGKIIARQSYGDIREIQLLNGDIVSEIIQDTQEKIRTFDTGADRDTTNNKLEYDGFLSSDVIESYARYMHKNRTRRDGTIRDSDNRKKGIPLDVYMKSMFRHFMDVWSLHESGSDTRERFDGEVVDMEESLNGLLFNVMGYHHARNNMNDGSPK